MRHLLTFIGLLVVAGVIASTCANKSIHQKKDISSNSSESEPATANFCAEDPSPETTSIEDEYTYFYGDTLWETDGKTWVYTSNYDEEEVEILSKGMITCYEDNAALDSCKVNLATGILTAEGNALKIIYGIDTLSYDISRLPKTLSPMNDLLPAGIRKHEMTHVFKLNDSAMTCKYHFTGYFPEKIPEWIKNYIAAVMYADLKMIFDENGDERDYLKEYKKQCQNPKRYTGINTASATPKEIGKYFAKRFERLYRKDFSKDEGFGPILEYFMEVTPAWSSEDGKLSTFRFYTYDYAGGAHGMMYEYYLTFDTQTGRILGINDLYDENEFKGAMATLGRKLNRRWAWDDDAVSAYEACLGEVDEEDTPKGIWYDSLDGYVYPRPALVKDGVVFSYQPYDKGSFADGILHFKLAYNRSFGYGKELR